jgi:hypothetical protein
MRHFISLLINAFILINGIIFCINFCVFVKNPITRKYSALCFHKSVMNWTWIWKHQLHLNPKIVWKIYFCLNLSALFKRYIRLNIFVLNCKTFSGTASIINENVKLWCFIVANYLVLPMDKLELTAYWTRMSGGDNEAWYKTWIS